MERNCFGNHDYNSNSTRNKTFRIVGHVFVGLLFAVAFALVFGLLVKFIWNSLMPAIFNLKEITYWQAFGIIILAKLLFGGFGHRHQDRREKSGKYFPHWHRSDEMFDEKQPPRKNDRNWKTYTKFWQEEGKAAFEAYMDSVEKKQNV
jgi:hypothetical protein